MIHLGALRLPFVSYEDENFLFYAGWQWSGFLGLKFNIKNSTLQMCEDGAIERCSEGYVTVPHPCIPQISLRNGGRKHPCEKRY